LRRVDDQFPAEVPGRVRPAEVGVARQSSTAAQQQVPGGVVAAILQMQPDLLGQRADAVGGGRRVGEAEHLARLGAAELLQGGDRDVVGVRLVQGSALA
jgi:hypothetical protein